MSNIQFEATLYDKYNKFKAIFDSLSQLCNVLCQNIGFL